MQSIGDVGEIKGVSGAETYHKIPTLIPRCFAAVLGSFFKTKNRYPNTVHNNFILNKYTTGIIINLAGIIMLNFKNNFLWKILEYSKFQDPIEKFDKEFRKKSQKAFERKESSRHKSKLLSVNEKVNI